MASFCKSAAIRVAFCSILFGASLIHSMAGEKVLGAASSPSALVAEVQHSFTLHGKVIPPEIFRDLGDGNLADSTSIWVTVDIEAAIGSNLYADAIREERGWFIQTKASEKTNDGNETSYKFIGLTANGLVVVITSYNGGGSGTFYTLHILDIAPARAFDLEGKIYPRINLTSVRSVVLGDRWDGNVRISKNSIVVVTIRNGPAGEGARPAMNIVAKRP